MVRDGYKPDRRNSSKIWHLEAQHSIRLDNLARDPRMPDLLHNLLAPLGRRDTPKVTYLHHPIAEKC